MDWWSRRDICKQSRSLCHHDACHPLLTVVGHGGGPGHHAVHRGEGLGLRHEGPGGDDLLQGDLRDPGDLEDDQSEARYMETSDQSEAVLTG